MPEIIKRAVVDSIDRDIDGAGTISVRISKVTSLDGIVQLRENHRTSNIEADDDIDTILSANSDYLEGEGFGRIELESVAFVKGVAALARTREAVKAAKERRKVAKMAADEAQMRADQERVQREEESRQAKAASEADLDRRIRETAARLISEAQA